jgi:phage terminase large subunit-like protein
MENKELIELKAKAAEELNLILVDDYHLEKTDKRLNVYAFEIINNPDDHNLYEILALKRFFHFLDKYIFKINEVKAFIVFYESLKFSGMKGRRRYKMTPVQVFQFANILGFYLDEQHRLIRDALLFVPRKFSKTTSVASLAIYDLLFGDMNAQAYVAANSYTQAQICFSEIKGILKCLDKRLKHFKINREKITNLKRGSFAQCLASDAETLDGLNASLNIIDEYSQARDSKLKDVLTSSMGVRINPLTIVITTASDKPDCPFRTDILDPYKSVLRGELENDRIFASIFEPDVDDAEDDPHTWKKVQPHLGITVQADFYENEYKKALMSADDMLAFRTKQLNLFVQPADKVWITSKEIEELYNNTELSKATATVPAMVAVDLSVCDDFSAVSYNLYNKLTRSFFIYTDFYFPMDALERHPNRELYQKWIDKGFLKLLPGKVINYEMIANDIFKHGSYMNILQIGYDPYKSKEFVNTIDAFQFGHSNPIPQTYGNFTSGVESMEIAVHTKKVSFYPNPIIAWCFGNCIIDEDKMENRKPLKQSHLLKIDGAITSIMTLMEFDDYKQKVKI